MHVKKIFFIVLTGLLLTACQGDKSTTLQDSLTRDKTVDTISNLDYGNNVIPFPDNLLFLDAAGKPPADGTLQIPVADPTDLSDPKVAMDALDGFSTVAPITTSFTGALDEKSFSTGVRLYEVTLDPGGSGAVVSVNKMLKYGVDFAATLSSVDKTNSTLVISPLKPLKPKQTYMAVITDGVKSASGHPVGVSGSYQLTHGLNPLFVSGKSTTPLLTDAQAQQLEPLRQATVVAESALNAFDGTKSSDIILSWSFTTQSITDVLEATRTQDRALTTTAGFLPAVAAPSPLGAADIHVGTIQIPYYLTASSTATSPSHDPTALGSCWNGISPPGSPPATCAGGPFTTQYNPAPVKTSMQTIPMLVSIPKIFTGCPGSIKPAKWPVVIFQHGITRSRADMLAVADSFASACMAVVAIDMPMHGITGNETDGSAAFKNPAANGGERTFDLDLVTQDPKTGAITAPVPDGIIDTSGSHFINLSNLLNTRDNVRQAVSDLFVLVDDIEKGSITDGTNIMDPTKIYFLGHSLGAMVGTTFAALEPDVRAVVFAFGGGSLPKILDGSATFGPTISAGLAANGVIKGTPDYESFMGAAQTVVDSGDPINFTGTVATAPAGGRGVLFFEIVGSNSSPSDLVVPNRVPDSNDTTGTVPAPLAGTDPLLKLLGLMQVDTTQGPGTANLEVVTRYIAGNHSSLLNPADTTVPPDAFASVPGENATVTTEMQTEAANFLGSDGHFLKVTDSSVLQAPPIP